MYRAVLSPCCNCGRYWVAVLLSDENVFVETRNVSADSPDAAKKALAGYVQRRYGAPLSSMETDTR